MSEHQHGDDPETDRKMSRANWVFIIFLAIAGFYLITEHTAHLLGWLPFALLLLCPLMHMFMHGGHGAHGGDRRGDVGAGRKDRDAGGAAGTASSDSARVGHHH